MWLPALLNYSCKRGKGEGDESVVEVYTYESRWRMSQKDMRGSQLLDQRTRLNFLY